MATTILQKLGFLINMEKSEFFPSTKCKFLGYIFDSKKMSDELPQDNREKIQRWVLKLITCKACKILTFAKLLGLLTSACPAVKYDWVYKKKKLNIVLCNQAAKIITQNYVSHKKKKK